MDLEEKKRLSTYYLGNDGESMMISVIMPAYNVKKYISRCIDSILNQSYKDFELIIIDDGSTDGTDKIIDEYALKDKRIIARHKANEGQAKARNLGLDLAKGDYICFIDSDDWIEQNYLEELLKICTEQKVQIAQCEYRSVQDVGDSSDDQKYTGDIEIMSGEAAIGRLYTKHSVETVVVWNKMYAKGIFEDVRFPEGMIHEDEAIIPMLLYRGDSVAIADVCLYNYRIDNFDSTMGKKYSLKHLDMLKALDIRMNFFKEKGLRKYYEDDSFKYLYKILLNIIDIRNSDDIQNSGNIIKTLKKDYWEKYKESLGFNWSIQRKCGMFVFGLIPKLYLLRYKK